jgi:Aspartyl protease
VIGVPIQIVDGLPFVAVTLQVQGQTLVLEHVLLDTGSGGTVFKTDDLKRLGLVLLPTDRLRFLRGIGGDEAVIEKSIESMQVGLLVATPFTIQVGAVDYGIAMDGILGLDFLLHTQAVIDLNSRQLRSAS